VRLLPMNIDPLYLSPTYILLGVINGYYNFSLLIWLVTNRPQELVVSCSWNLGQTSVSLWHRLCILTRYFSMPNIPLYHCILHLSLSFVSDPLLDTRASLLEF
jgi:hypothetical protein